MNNDILSTLNAITFTSPLGEELVILPRHKLMSLIEEASKPHEVLEIDEIIALLTEIDTSHENLIFSLDSEEGFHRLKSIRKAKNLNQKQLAEQTSLSQPLISSLENKTNEGTVETWIKIADSLDVSLDFLLR